MANYLLNRLSMRVVISGGDLDSSVEVPCTAAYLKFKVDEIPQAVFSIATGFKGLNPNVVSEIHNHSDSFSRQLSIQAYLIVDGDYSPGKKWPDVELLIFDGFVSSVGSNVDTGTSRINISCVHWLAILGFTSAYSKWLHPSAPNDFLTKPANLFTFTQGGPEGAPATSNVVFTAGSGDEFRDLTTKNIRDDLWQKIIKSVLYYMATVEAFNLENVAGQAARPKADFINEKAVLALDRMDNKKQIKVVKLPIVTASKIYEEKISTELAMNFFNSAYGSTYWHKLLVCANKFLFTVVPNVQSATCAPITPFLNDVWETIEPDEYKSFSTYSGMPVLMRGLIGLGSGIPLVGEMISGIPGMAGMYDLAEFDEKYKDGVWMVRQLPPWIHDLVVSAYMHEHFEGKLNHCCDPDAKKVVKHEPDFTHDKELSDNYIKAMFLRLVYENRRANLVGKLRFDIAPGSNVCIIGQSASQPTFHYYKHYATVVGVEIRLDAATSTATTSYELSHLHTFDEHNFEAFKTTKHPVFNTAWTGSPLIHLDGYNKDPN